MNSTTFKSIIISALSICLLMACSKGPKVIPSSSDDTSIKKTSGIFDNTTDSIKNTDNNQSFTDDLHTVIVHEILPTKKYMYLKVLEDKKEFWIATRSKDIVKGKTYFYRGGLLKTNFESKEYNRIFETVYLVSNLVEATHAKNSSFPTKNNTPLSEPSWKLKEDIPTHTEKIVEHKGSIKIAELVKNPKKYEGKTIQISGTCVKINPAIMDRNWIHIKDGSKDDYDLVITSNTFVPEGSVITMMALVTLNKDFGAGYTYDLILEDGTIIK